MPPEVNATPTATDQTDAPEPVPQQQDPTAQQAPQAPAAPSGPATAPADAMSASTTSGFHSVLGGVVMGALAGAAKASGNAVKQRLRNFAMNSPRGQELQANALARQEAQQKMQLAQKQESRAEQQALDTHQESVLRANGISLDNMRKVAENAQLGKTYDFQNKSNEITLGNMQRAQDSADRELWTNMAEAGIHLDSSHGPGHDNLTQDHAQSVAQGKQIMLSNGQTGDDAGYHFVSNDELRNTVLDKDTPVAVDWKMDSKTGTLTPVYQTFRQGQNTWWDALIAHDAGIKKAQELQTTWANNAKNAETLTNIEKNMSEAEKDRAEAKKALFEAGSGVGDPNLTGTAYLNSLPATMKDLVGGLLNYQVKPTDLGRAQNRQIILAATLHADPGAGTPNQWSEAKYEERYNFLKEWGDSKSGAGATRNRINTAVGHLNYLAQASQALAQSDLPALNRVANAIGVQTGNSAKIVYDSIAQKAAAEAAGAMKGGGTAPTDPEIESTFKQFSGDMGATQRLEQIRAQLNLLQTQIDTQRGQFQQVMGVAPDQFGQPVLYGQNAAIMKAWLGQKPANAVGTGTNPKDGKLHWAGPNNEDLGPVQ